MIRVRNNFAILDTFELSQHVKGATYCKGHTLDLIITKDLSDADISVIDPSLFDLFIVFFSLFLTYRSNQILSKNSISMIILEHYLKKPSPCYNLW